MASKFWGLCGTVLTLAAAGCGDAGPHSTDPVPLARSSTGDLAPHSWACALEVFSIDSDVSASVTPVSLYLELRPGSCNSDANAVGASSTGTLKIRVQAGVYHVEVGNPSDATVRYSLTVQYATPSI